MATDDHEYAPGYSADIDPYVDANGLLINNLGITNTADLNIAEADFYSARIAELRDNPIKGNFDIDHAKVIHKHLFQDVYPWAGEVRTVNIMKGDDYFSRNEYIENEFRKLTEQLHKENNLKGLEPDKFAERAGYYLGKLNTIHPFREGNGRTQREFINELAHEAGYKVFLENVGKEAMKQASITAFQGDSRDMAKLIRLNLEPLPEQVLNRALEVNALDDSRQKLDVAQSAAEMNRIAQQFKAQPLPGGLTAVVESADLKVLTPYTGKIVALTEHHALQQTGANKFVVHARTMSAPQDFQQGKQATIVYGQSRDLIPQTISAYAKGKQASYQTPAAKLQQTADRSHKGRSR